MIILEFGLTGSSILSACVYQVFDFLVVTIRRVVQSSSIHFSVLCNFCPQTSCLRQAFDTFPIVFKKVPTPLPLELVFPYDRVSIYVTK